MSGECDNCSEHTLDCICRENKGTQMEWISIKERYPETSDIVLVSDGEEVAPMRYFGQYKGSDDWSSYFHNVLDVTHWMPLPEPPQHD